MVFVLLLIIFIVGTGGFGFFSYIEGFNISTPVGTLEIGQILVIIALLICFLKRKRRRINIRGTILFPLIFFVYLIILQFFRGVLTGLSLQLSLRGIKRIYMFLYIFPLIILIKNRTQLQKFINCILLIGLISAFVAIYQFSTGSSLGASSVSSFEGFSRVYHPGGVLMAFCFFISLSHLLIFGIQKKYNWMYIISIFYIIGIITTLHRNLIGSTVICSAVMIIIYLFYERKIRSIWKPIFGAIIIIFALNYFLQKSGFGMEQLFLRAQTAITDIKYFEGTYAFRSELLIDTFSRIIKESPFIGVGFNYGSVANIFGTYYITNDNTYNNILVMFGLIGLVIWFFLLYKIANISINKYKVIIKSPDKALYLAILTMPLFLLIVGFFSAIIIYSANLTILITLIAILYLLDYFQMHARIGVNKYK